MKRTKASLFFSVLILCAVSCKKSQSGAANGLTGSYKLVNIHAHTYSSVDETDAGVDYQTVTVSDYTSINNGGGLNIAATTMSTVNMTYAVSTTLQVAEFIDGVFQDSLSSPFDMTIPPTSNVSSYKLIGKDSIYFPSGFVNSPGGGGAVQTIAVGAKYVVSGTKLTMTIVVPPQVSTQNAGGGVTIKSSSSATETITLQKQ